ncbi:hypothetical protein PHBOTO_001750 [Pseudozyma hubeiensis]|nr:hypothetical protein PHBOTO_001750 [Pseudozyma hubeiensis]
MSSPHRLLALKRGRALTLTTSRSTPTRERSLRSRSTSTRNSVRSTRSRFLLANLRTSPRRGARPTRTSRWPRRSLPTAVPATQTSARFLARSPSPPVALSAAFRRKGRRPPALPRRQPQARAARPTVRWLLRAPCPATWLASSPALSSLLLLAPLRSSRRLLNDRWYSRRRRRYGRVLKYGFIVGMTSCGSCFLLPALDVGLSVEMKREL